MLNDNFKEIEDFLKTDGNSELYIFQTFEKIVNEFVQDKFTVNPTEGFLNLNTVLYETYNEFNKNNSNTIKDFAIVVILIKNAIMLLQNNSDNIHLTEEDKHIYIDLAKKLVGEIKKEAENNIAFFKVFADFTDDIDNLFNSNN